ncbi:MAG: family 20 glycosylhydrolase [Fimbriimonas sp.]|nr:family 20 glycosylhydrolase [Fimbriimonas sp.]
MRVLADRALGNERKEAIAIVGDGHGALHSLRLKLQTTLSDLGEEGYRLKVDRSGVTISARKAAGVFYGLQTLRQLESVEHGRITVPCVDIADKPRFAWRGNMLDVSRHFFPKKDIEHFLDLLSQYKINTFHWHLVDDGGWRLQIRKYPKLTEVGAWRLPSDGTFPEYSGLTFPGAGESQKQYGGFYTQEDAREIVRYAASRHINIVPEIEMPGHNLAATMSYPWLICDPKLQPGFLKAEGFVFPNIFCAGKESTFKFVEDVLDEVMAIFPSRVIHIGGDEVDKYLWERCDDCKATMKREHLANSAQLESYFVRRVEKYVNAHGRHIIGWDEILEGGLAPNAYVMSWRGEAGGIEASKQHHFVVMTPWDQCYFDHSNLELPIDVILGYDPAPPSRGKEMARFVMGAQASIWTETLPDRRHIEDRLFPRILAMSEILWTNRRESTASFLDRLDRHLPTLYSNAPGLHLPAPRADLQVVAPGTGFNWHYPNIRGFTLRYTTDGSLPDHLSKPVPEPMIATSGERITAALVGDKGRRGDTGSVSAWDMEPVVADSISPGLRYRLYAGYFRTVPDFASLTSIQDGTTGQIKLMGDLKEHFALEFDGYLVINHPGRYTFLCGSDDGSVVWLGGLKMLDNDGSHGMLFRSVTLDLKAGAYPLKLGYFQQTEGAGLSFEVSGPGMPRQPVPPPMLYH